MRRADIEVPNRSVDMGSWDRSACYPRGTFYPLSDGPSTWDRRITRPCFRTCSTCRSRSQAPLCPCTRQLIADQLEGTFGRLRYNLGSLLARQLVPHLLDHVRIHHPHEAIDLSRWDIHLKPISLESQACSNREVPFEEPLQHGYLTRPYGLRIQIQAPHRCGLPR